jgi:hypothetical protein
LRRLQPSLSEDVGVEVELALLDQPHDGERGGDLGHGGDPDRIVGRDPAPGAAVGEAGGVLLADAAASKLAQA